MFEFRKFLQFSVFLGFVSRAQTDDLQSILDNLVNSSLTTSQPTISTTLGFQKREKFNQYTSDDILIEAVTSVITNYFMKRTSTLNFCSASSGLYEKAVTQDLINRVIDKVDTNIIIQLQDFTHIKQMKTPRTHNVFFVDNYESFRSLFGAMKPENFEYQGYYLVVITDYYKSQLSGVKSILSDFWNIFIVNVNILTKSEDGRSAQLYTYFPYTESFCSKVKPILWNRFENGGFLIESEWFPNKMENLFNCSLKVVSFNIPPMMMIELRPDGNHVYKGVDGELLFTLAERMNFRINLTFMADDSLKWGALFENGTSRGAMKMVINGDVNFTIGEYSITALRNEFMTSSQSYFNIPVVIIVPPGQPYTAFEKLFKPFHSLVWIIILVIFLIAFGVIFLVKFSSRPARNFIFDEHNQSPFLNILNIFVGGSMTSLPAKNFPRVLLMIFILYCLVIRTLYQGGLFDNLQSEARGQKVGSVQEMLDRQFIFYILQSSLEYTDDLKFSKSRQVVQSSEIDLYRRKSLNPGFKGAVLASLERVVYLNTVNFKNFSYEICKEYLMTFQYGIYFRKHSYLTKSINKKIGDFQSSGLFQMWERASMDYKYLFKPPAKKEPRKLNISQLLGGFEILILGFITGFLILILEIISFKIAVLRKFFEFINGVN